MTAHMLGGERPPTRAVWWALLALYLFAAFAEAVVAGDDAVCAAACAAPALLAAVPGVGAALATVGTEYAAAALPSPEHETEEWHATMDAWVDAFMVSYRAQRRRDRRWSNGGREVKELRKNVDWEEVGAGSRSTTTQRRSNTVCHRDATAWHYQQGDARR